MSHVEKILDFAWFSRRLALKVGNHWANTPGRRFINAKTMESRPVCPFHLTDRRTTVVLGNVIVIITCRSDNIHKYLHVPGIRFLMHFKVIPGEAGFRTDFFQI